MALREVVLAAIRERPLGPIAIARAAGVPAERVAVCLGALQRDGKAIPTVDGWRTATKAPKPRPVVKPLTYDRITPSLACAAVDGLVRLRVSGHHGGTVPLMHPADVIAAAEWVREVGLDGSAAG
jgi:hypothetical protein